MLSCIHVYTVVKAYRNPVTHTLYCFTLFIGYYDIPENVQTELLRTTADNLAEVNEEVIRLGITYEKNNSERSPGDGKTTDTNHEHLVAVVWGECVVCISKLLPVSKHLRE